MNEPRTNISLSKDPDLIWGMVAGDRIEMRFDCGDAGLISLTREQAIDLKNQLEDLISSQE